MADAYSVSPTAWQDPKEADLSRKTAPVEPIIPDKRGYHDSISKNHEGQARQTCDIVGA